MVTISDQEPEQNEHEGQGLPTPSRNNTKVARWVLNGLIAILFPLLGISAYLYFAPPTPGDTEHVHPQNQQLAQTPATTGSDQPGTAGQPNQPQQAGKQDTSGGRPAKVIQLDVLNGCGAKGAGIKMTGFLRAHGFDVVEMKNYKSFHVQQTLIVDRIGDLGAARRVAAALGVNEKNVIQKINPDYYVEVSVIIGKDFMELVK